MKKITGLLRLLRFELPFAAGICVVMGQLFALGEFPPVKIILSGFISVFFISASILVLNDYFDVETDKINAPHRPIPSGLVTPIEALIYSIILLLAGVIISWLINPITGVISISLSIIGFLYNRYFKKSGLPGNLLVSISVGMTFIYGGAAVNLTLNRIVILFSLIAALVDLGEEIAADSMDMEGDRLINSKSIAIKYGRKAAIKASMAIFLLIILLTVIPFAFKWFSLLYLIPICIMDISILYFSLKLYKAEGAAGRMHIRGIYLGATSGLIVFLIMRLLGI